MAIFIIEPFKRVGHVVFGAEREIVRREMGTYKEFRKSRFSKNTTDAFGGCHVYYDQENHVEAVELFRGETPIYKNKNLFLFTPEQIARLIADEKMTRTEYSVSFPTYGIDLGLAGGEIDSVFIHTKEY